MTLIYFDISLPADEESAYHVLPNGIARLNTKDFVLFVRPANKVQVAEGQQLWLWPSKHPRSDFLLAEWHYPKGSSLTSKPDYFYIELLVRAKTDGYAVYPKQVRIITPQGERIPPAKYILVEKGLENPPNYGGAYLLNFAPLDNPFNLQQERTDNIAISLPVGQLRGVAVRFPMPPPTPGEVFTIAIDGLAYRGTPVAIPPLTYDRKKTYTSAYP